MRSPTTLTFRHTDHSSALEGRARELGQRLQRYGERISHCHMTIEGSRGAHTSGAAFVVQIDLAVPGAQIHADSLQIDGTGHEDVYVALRDAFNNAKRQLQELHSKRFRFDAGATIERLGAAKTGTP
ncbi:MAG: HPF/RaiA family ribosome-associated protein [Steroidobacteraceae bacterium]